MALLPLFLGATVQNRLFAMPDLEVMLALKHLDWLMDGYVWLSVGMALVLWVICLVGVWQIFKGRKPVLVLLTSTVGTVVATLVVQVPLFFLGIGLYWLSYRLFN